jgi:uncharacterized phage protein (TIGR02218 family)
MPIYEGQMGDYGYDRQQLQGQARGELKSSKIKFPYYTYQDKCTWRFGGAGCGVNAGSYELNMVNSAINVGSSTSFKILVGSGILTQSYANGRFDFGRLQVTAGINSGQIRTIRSHSGDLLSLSHSLAVNSFSDMTFTIRPGCRKRLKEDCTSLYNNAENFLGFPYIPVMEKAF